MFCVEYERFCARARVRDNIWGDILEENRFLSFSEVFLDIYSLGFCCVFFVKCNANATFIQTKRMHFNVDSLKSILKPLMWLLPPSLSLHYDVIGMFIDGNGFVIWCKVIILINLIFIAVVVVIYTNMYHSELLSNGMRVLFVRLFERAGAVSSIHRLRLLKQTFFRPLKMCAIKHIKRFDRTLQFFGIWDWFCEPANSFHHFVCHRRLQVNNLQSI